MENKTFDQMNLLDSFLFGTTLGYEEYGKEVSGITVQRFPTWITMTAL